MELEIFSDETYILNNKYMGIGCLFVPVNYKYTLAQKLFNYRCLNEKSSKWNLSRDSCETFNNGYCKGIYHKNNDCEIHYADFRKNMSISLKRISTSWINFLVYHNKNCLNDEKIYFNILYLDLEKLDKTFFGDDITGNNIYNRFYKTAITGPLKNFFKSYNHIVVKEIFHDISDDKKAHDYFSWHTPYKLNKEKNITIKKEEISFIESDHKNYEINDENYVNSTFIQFIDLILGCTNHALFRESKDKERMVLYSHYYPLLKRLWEQPNKKYSSFNYFKSQEVSIFPKDKITYYTDLFGVKHRKNGEFHRNIKLIPPEVGISTPSLENFIKNE